MYCNHCGADMRPEERFCSRCGKPVGEAAFRPGGRVARHLTVLGILWVVLSAMRLFRGGGHMAGAPVLAGFGNRWIHHIGGDWPVGDLLAHILFVSGAALVILAALGFAAGWGLIERKPWARTLALVLGFLSLLSPVLGTALGIYTLWVLLPAESEVEFYQLRSA